MRQQAAARLPDNTVIVWVMQGGEALRARVVAFVPAGTSPVDVAPQLRSNRRRIQFRNPSAARNRDHYLVVRNERKGELGDVPVYYLPYAACVNPVRGGA